jgi:TP901 family phage tail tape measure protein
MAATNKIQIDSAAGGAGIDQTTKGLREMGETAAKSGGGFNALKEVAIGALRQVGAAAVQAGAEAARAMGAFVADSISAAGNFEAAVNGLAAVTGSALSDAGFSMEDVSAKALQLGKDTQFSAQEAIAAMTELAKGGVAIESVMTDATDATLALASASGTDLATSAEIVAKQLGVWGETGVSAAQVTDLLASAANASTVGVEDLALGLANAGGTAKTAGVEFSDLVQSMALIAPNFSSASDAGTSFKTFLSRLVPTTDPATMAMADLGLWTEKTGSAFYDAQGNFVGMAETARLLQAATAGLSEEQKLLAFNTIFGSDAIRAAAAIANAGADGFNAMGESMTASGGAAEAAAAKNQGFNFALEQMKGSVETLQIVLGTAFLPMLTQLVGQFTTGLNAVMTFADTFLRLAPAITESANPLQTFVNVLAVAASSAVPGAGAAILTFWGNMQTLIGAAQQWIAAVQQVVTQLMTALQPAITAIAGFVTTTLIPALTQLGGWLLTQLPAATQTTVNLWNGVLLPAISAISTFIATSVIPALTTLVQWLQVNVPAATAAVVSFWSTQLLPILQNTSAFLQSTVLPLISELAAFLGTKLAPEVQKAHALWAGLYSGVLQPLGAFIAANFIPVLQNIPSPIQDIMAGVEEAKRGFSTWKPMLDAVAGAFRAIAGAVEGASKALNSFVSAAAKAASASIPSLPKLPGMAAGGPVSSGQAYVVGEVGPEIFVPNSSGRIIPNNQVTNNYNYSPTYSAVPNQPSRDFNTMRALATAGT